MTAGDRTFSVTLVKVGPTLPYFEVGAYRYTAEWLPRVGETISISRATGEAGDATEMLRGYVTRVSPASDTPISVVEVEGTEPDEIDDLLA
jgi:hypothetical protein